jgi:hypothetical protein
MFDPLPQSVIATLRSNETAALAATFSQTSWPSPQGSSNRRESPASRGCESLAMAAAAVAEENAIETTSG